MTARGGMMPPSLAHYAARRQRAAKHSLDDTHDIGEQDGGDVLGTLLRLVGDDATLILLEEYGGTRMSVPSAAGDGTKLTTLIGLAAAGLVSAHFGGGYVRIPVARAWRGAAYRKRGWSNTRIAKALCITDSAVARMLKNPPASAVDGVPVSAGLGGAGHVLEAAE